MSLLDDLKQQADALRQKQQVTQQEMNQNLPVSHGKLKDPLHYWVELFGSLNVIKPVIPRFYYLEGGSRSQTTGKRRKRRCGRRTRRSRQEPHSKHQVHAQALSAGEHHVR